MIQKSSRSIVGSETKLTPEERLVSIYRDYPEAACRDLLGIKPTWWQRVSLRDFWFKNRVLWVWNRGAGKDWMGDVCALLYAGLFPLTKVMLLAPIFGQQKKMFGDLQTIWSMSPFLQDATIGEPSIGNDRCLLKFKNGSTILARPVGTGAKIKGERANVLVINEYDNMDQGIVNSVIKPFMRIKQKGRENKTIIMSNATYRFNHLWPLFVFHSYKQSVEPDNYGVQVVNYKDVLAYEHHLKKQGITPEFEFDRSAIQEDRVLMTKDEFDMNNMSIFPSEDVSYFSPSLIDGCTPKVNEGVKIEFSGNHTNDYFFGVDPAFAEAGDNFATVVLKHIGNWVFEVVHVGSSEFWKTLPQPKKKDFPQLEMEIRKLLKKFPNTKRFAMDAGNAGGGPTLRDYLKKEIVDEEGIKYDPVLEYDERDDELRGDKLLQMVYPTPAENTRVGTRLKRQMEKKDLRLPIGRRRVLPDEDSRLQLQLDEFSCLRRELQMIDVKTSKNASELQFLVPRKYRKDRFTALTLALEAAISYLGEKEGREDNSYVPISGNWVNRGGLRVVA